jgi:protein SCO1/2
MTTQDGRPLDLADLRGKVVILTFVYTRCPLPDFCPLMDRRFSELAAMASATAARAEKIRLLSVSFDPEHDTPEALARHAARVGARPPVWTYAVASHEELRKVAPPLGLAYAPTGTEIRHGLATAVIAPDGTLARLESGNRWAAADLFATARSALAEAADAPTADGIQRSED